MKEQATMKKLGKSKIILAVAALVLLTIVTSMVIGIFTNGSSQSESVTTDNVGGSTAGEIANPGAINDSYKVAPAQPTVAAAYAGAPAATVAPARGSASAPVTNNQPGTGASYNQVNTDPSRMIIRNATLAIESEEVEKTLNEIRSLIVAQQGTVFSSNTTLRNDKTYATMVLQVPSQVYDATMAQLRKIAFKVQSETSTSQDVTEEFADAEAQLRNLKATEAQYLELLKKANSVNDTITVQNQLTNVRGQIERLQGRMNFLQKKSDFSTITVNIAPHIPPSVTKTDPNAWELGKAFENAWNGSMKGLRGLTVALINVGVYMVWILPIAGLLFLIGFVWWRRTFPRKSKTTESNPPVILTE